MTGARSALRGVCVATAAAAIAGLAGPAWAQSDALRDGLFRNRPGPTRTAPRPPVARYVSEAGEAFILDQSQSRPLLKFEGSPEVWLLAPQPAPRGDVIFKNDLGEPVLRATRLGGYTLFTDHRPEGAPVALAGDGPPLRLAPLSPMALLERLNQARIRSSRAAQHGIDYEAEATPASSALIADAAMVTSVAVIRIAERRDGRKVLGRLEKVVLTEGSKVSASFAEQVLRITVAPPLGFAGRPSSQRVIHILTGNP